MFYSSTLNVQSKEEHCPTHTLSIEMHRLIFKHTLPIQISMAIYSAPADEGVGQMVQPEEMAMAVVVTGIPIAEQASQRESNS